METFASDVCLVLRMRFILSVFRGALDMGRLATLIADSGEPKLLERLQLLVRRSNSSPYFSWKLSANGPITFSLIIAMVVIFASAVEPVQAGTDAVRMAGDMDPKAKEDIKKLLYADLSELNKEKLSSLLGYSLTERNPHMELGKKYFSVQYIFETSYLESSKNPTLYYDDYIDSVSRERVGFSVGGSFELSHKSDNGCVLTGDLIGDAKSAGWEIASNQVQTINHSLLLKKGPLRLGIISEGGIGEVQMTQERYKSLSRAVAIGGCVEFFSIGVEGK